MACELETERLRLRPWRESDIAPFAGFCANPATMRYLNGPCSRDDAWRRMAAFAGHWCLRGYGIWVIEEKASGEFAGYSGLWNPAGWPEPEVVWGLKEESQGRGCDGGGATRARLRLRRAWMDDRDQSHRGREWALAACRRASRRRSRAVDGIQRVSGWHPPPSRSQALGRARGEHACR